MISLRTLGKHWKLTLIAVFSLAVAMALAVLSLSMSDTFLLASPAAPEANRLVNIHGHSAEIAVDEISYPDYQYLREHNHVFTDIAAAPNSISINGEDFEGREVKVISRPVSGNYFAVLGIRAERGRLLAPGDEASKTHVAVMTHACWHRLGSDPKIVGKVLFGNTIVGVTGEQFTGGFYGLNGDLFVALNDSNYNAEWRTQRDARHLMLLARLKADVTRRQAQVEIAALSGQLASAYPKEDKGRSAVVTRATLLPPDGIATAELALSILMGLVILVLLIACANVANLLLAVAVGRRQEAAIKLALGAQRSRLIREFLGESALLCAGGAALGYVAAVSVVRRFSHLEIDFGVLGTFSFGINLHLNAAVIGFTLLLVLIAIVATGLPPALYASSPHLATLLGSEAVAGGRRKGMRRNALAVVQVAVCTFVLIGMGLCHRNLYNLRHVDPGFSARNLVAVQVYPASDHESDTQIKNTYQRLRASVAALPGVESTALSLEVPLSLGFWKVAVEFPDHTRQMKIAQNVIDENYFATFGIPLLEGRNFNSGDREGRTEAIVINRKAAETFWPRRDPLGQALLVGDAPLGPAPATGQPQRRAVVIGVTANGKYSDFDEPDQPVIYSALGQHSQAGFTIVARTKGDPRLWVGPISRVVREAGLTTPFHPLTYEAWSNFPLLLQRLAAAIVDVLSGLGLMLAAIGLAGAMSYAVSERKKELGIRVALGAGRRDLLAMILRQTAAVSSIGILAGILLGVAATALLRSKLFGIGVVEWRVLVSVASGMLLVSLTVAYLSTRRWIRVNPMEAIRHA
ncbi:MAG: ABC transporter permease [Acidobacteriia bacterium]|nr:ABC transporter permease [Terriglobia bacterium]